MNNHDWSEEEKRRAQALVDGDARQLNTHHPNHHSVSPGECAGWRDRVTSEGVVPGEIESGYSRGTVETHVRGDCSHDPVSVGLPAVHQDSEWVRARVISTGTDPSNLRVYHTEVCEDFPESVERMPDGVLRQQWRECRTCSGRVPEAKRVPEAAGDD